LIYFEIILLSSIHYSYAQSDKALAPLEMCSLKELFLTGLSCNLHMKTLSCRDAGCDCDYVARGETDEVIRDAAQHGMKEHGKTQEDMTQMQANLKAAIHTS
jgi:predicted small metal-binding protein